MGTPNRATATIREKLASMNCDPAILLGELAMAPDTDPVLKARILADLLPYIAPKLASVTVEAINIPERFPNLVIGFLPKRETPPE